LKYFIFEYTRDAQYRDLKAKERSLRLVCRDSAVNRDRRVVVGWDANFQPIFWGRSSISLSRLIEKYSSIASSMLVPTADPALRIASDSYWRASDFASVAPKAYSQKGRHSAAVGGAVAGAAAVAAIWAFTHRRSREKRLNRHGSLRQKLFDADYSSDAE
jgi:hypothetical protein